MNLQNLSKGLNFPIGLTTLVAFILIILINTLELVKIQNVSLTLSDMPNDVQNTVYSIFSTSLICLIFNLIFTRFFKNKVLSSVLFLILLFSLFVSSIFLFVGTSKIEQVIIPTQVGAPVIDKNNVNAITGILYFLAVLALIASITNKGLTFYNLTK